MKLSDFNYELPQELIAQDPLLKRSDSRLMVLNRATGGIEHRHFSDVIEYLNPGDCLVINDTKVIPARLIGVKEDTGASIEVLLLKRHDDKVWETLVNRLIRFEYEGIFEEVLDELGQMPLPPYITHRLEDKDRYQTVYATHTGSAAAPTAGLHFTKELLAQIKEKGIKIARVTLHVGLGTFRPVKVENILEHHMHSEFYVIDEEAANTINETKANGGKIVSVGTTSTRTLETVADENGHVRACSGWTDIFIYPGYKFKVVDRLITNFHLPESTLLMLVSALYDREKILEAYKIAVEEKYRFFSFGDAMLIL